MISVVLATRLKEPCWMGPIKVMCTLNNGDNILLVKLVELWSIFLCFQWLLTKISF